MNARFFSMTGTGDGISPHQLVRDLLVEYLAEQQLGASVAPLPAAVAEHLARCEACSEWLAELEELSDVAFGDQLPAAPAYPTPDLSFLGPASSEPMLPRALLELDRFVVSFPHSFLTTLNQPSVAGALRGQFVFRQRFELEQAPGVVVTVEVMGRNSDVAASLCVDCELLGRDPLEQAGSRVVVRTRDGEWRGTTDDTGSVRFEGVPLAMLPDARIEIEPDVPP